MRDGWNPGQYDRFRLQRMEPFWDVLRLIQWAPQLKIVDLGCGTGELSVILSERLDAEVDAMDSSPSMLEKAMPRANSRVRFRKGDIAAESDFARYDVVFAHASLQWVPDHESLFARMLSAMKPGAQLAIQMPRNQGHASHAVAHELAATSPFREALAGYKSSGHGLALERYAELLDAHGFREQIAYEKVYGHRLDHSRDVIEWVKGTMLSGYLSALPDDLRDRFEAQYREALLRALGDHAPYFYPFRRMLLWGRKAA
jgi:trans-aconitate 2-methyltransferase